MGYLYQTRGRGGSIWKLAIGPAFNVPYLGLEWGGTLLLTVASSPPKEKNHWHLQNQ